MLQVLKFYVTHKIRSNSGRNRPIQITVNRDDSGNTILLYIRAYDYICRVTKYCDLLSKRVEYYILKNEDDSGLRGKLLKIIYTIFLIYGFLGFS